MNSLKLNAGTSRSTTSKRKAPQAQSNAASGKQQAHKKRGAKDKQTIMTRANPPSDQAAGQEDVFQWLTGHNKRLASEVEKNGGRFKVDLANDVFEKCDNGFWGQRGDPICQAATKILSRWKDLDPENYIKMKLEKYGVTKRSKDTLNLVTKEDDRKRREAKARKEEAKKKAANGGWWTDESDETESEEEDTDESEESDSSEDEKQPRRKGKKGRRYRKKKPSKNKGKKRGQPKNDDDYNVVDRTPKQKVRCATSFPSSLQPRLTHSPMIFSTLTQNGNRNKSDESVGTAGTNGTAEDVSIDFRSPGGKVPPAKDEPNGWTHLGSCVTQILQQDKGIGYWVGHYYNPKLVDVCLTRPFIDPQFEIKRVTEMRGMTAGNECEGYNQKITIPAAEANDWTAYTVSSDYLSRIDVFNHRKKDDPELIAMAKSCWLLKGPAGHHVLRTCHQEIHDGWMQDQSKCLRCKKADERGCAKIQEQEKTNQSPAFYYWLIRVPRKDVLDNRILTDDDEELYHDLSKIKMAGYVGFVKCFRIGVMNSAEGGKKKKRGYNVADLTKDLFNMQPPSNGGDGEFADANSS